MRDTVALPPDWYLNPVAYLNPEEDRYWVSAANIVQVRAGLLDLEEMASGDRYTFIRDAWLQRREYLINDGEVEDEFGGEYDEYSDDF